MTTATFHRTDNMYRITIEGHATGSKEACAAASILLSTLVNCLVIERNAGNLQIIKHEEDDEAGKFYLKFRTMPGMHQAATVVSVIGSGYVLLSKQFPDHVRFERRGDW